MNYRVDHQDDGGEFVPLRESGGQSEFGGERELRRVVLHAIDNAGHEDVENEQLQDEVGDRQSGRYPRAWLNADEALEECLDRAASLNEMQEQHDHEQDAENHVQRDAVAQCDQREQGSRQCHEQRQVHVPPSAFAAG